MLKIAVFDSGFGGELFADKLEEELDIVEVIRVIDWRNAEKILFNKRSARNAAEAALRPYINHVDLIIFANHLISLTGLKYFRRKYPNQKFIGFNLKDPETFLNRRALILATKAVSKTQSYHRYRFRLRRENRTILLDSWPTLIDDGELSPAKICEDLETFLVKTEFSPNEIILACSQFNDVKPELREFFGHNIKIYDSFDEAFRLTCKALGLRGGIGRKK